MTYKEKVNLGGMLLCSGIIGWKIGTYGLIHNWTVMHIALLSILAGFAVTYIGKLIERFLP